MLLYQVSHGSDSSLSVTIQFVAFTNTAVNPIVYSLRSKEYRKALFNLLKRINIKSSVLDAIPNISAFQSTTTSSTQPKIGGQRKGSLWIENSDMMTVSNSFTVVTPLHRTSTLENVLHDLVKGTYLSEEPEDLNHYDEPSGRVKIDINSLPDRKLSADSLERSTLEPSAQIIQMQKQK